MRKVSASTVLRWLSQACPRGAWRALWTHSHTRFSLIWAQLSTCGTAAFAIRNKEKQLRGQAPESNSLVSEKHSCTIYSWPWFSRASQWISLSIRFSIWKWVQYIQGWRIIKWALGDGSVAGDYVSAPCMVWHTYLITRSVCSCCHPRTLHKVIQMQILALRLISKLLNLSEPQFPEVYQTFKEYQLFTKFSRERKRKKCF